MPYPTVITPEELARLAHISDAELQSDIEQAKLEAKAYAHLSFGYATLAILKDANPEDARMNVFKAGGYSNRLDQVTEQIIYLKRLAEARKEAATHKEEF